MRETITSIHNPLIIEYVKLKNNKYRKLSNRYLLEGVKLVDEAIKCGVTLECILTVDKLSSNYIDNANCQVITVSDECIVKLSEAVTPQGVVAVAKTDYSIVKPSIGKAILLDGLTDIGNVGTIMRTAVACGYKDIYLINNCVDIYSYKCLRAAMTAHFYLNIYNCSLNEVISLNKNHQLIVADMEGDDLFDCKKILGTHILSFGSEANGISTKLKEMASLTISLPMSNVESLNVSISAAIIMYQLSYGNKI